MTPSRCHAAVTLIILLGNQPSQSSHKVLNLHPVMVALWPARHAALANCC